MSGTLPAIGPPPTGWNEVPSKRAKKFAPEPPMFVSLPATKRSLPPGRFQTVSPQSWLSPPSRAAPTECHCEPSQRASFAVPGTPPARSK
jgi:hypothetical protein